MQAHCRNVGRQFTCVQLAGDLRRLQRSRDARLRFRASVHICKLRGEHGEGRKIRNVQRETTGYARFRCTESLQRRFPVEQTVFVQARV